MEEVKMTAENEVLAQNGRVNYKFGTPSEVSPAFATKAVISLSGGMDSTCLMMYLFGQGITEIRAYSFDYGQKHDIELKKVKKNIKYLQSKGFNVIHQTINLRDVFSDSASALHKGGKDIPHEAYDAESQKDTVIENRNVIFSAIVFGKALGWANKTGENVYISLGIHANDFSIYPDCRPESQDMAKQLFKISNWNSERVDYVAPFVNIDKASVLKAGIDAMKKLGFTKPGIMKILKNTHSCYDVDENGVSCGSCGTCRERRYAFYVNGIEDPIQYAPDAPSIQEIIKDFE